MQSTQNAPSLHPLHQHLNFINQITTQKCQPYIAAVQTALRVDFNILVTPHENNLASTPFDRLAWENTKVLTWNLTGQLHLDKFNHSLYTQMRIVFSRALSPKETLNPSTQTMEKCHRLATEVYNLELAKMNSGLKDLPKHIYNIAEIHPALRSYQDLELVLKPTL